jgi:hypothetical protein
MFDEMCFKCLRIDWKGVTTYSPIAYEAFRVFDAVDGIAFPHELIVRAVRAVIVFEINPVFTYVHGGIFRHFSLYADDIC